MRIFKLVIFSCLILAVGYLLAWPVAIAPRAWHAPSNLGYQGAFEANDRLKNLRFLELGGETGPEDVAVRPDGVIFASVHSGKILKIDRNGGIQEFANPGGRVLGLEFGRDGVLYAADAYLGLLKFRRDGTFETLSNRTSSGSPLLYANDLDVSASGVVYFSDASTKFGAKANSGTLPASLLDIAEHGGHGRVLKHDPSSGETTVLLTGLNFANGVALSQDEAFLLIAETGHYRILKYWLKGPKAGTLEVLLSNLPGFPDNLSRDQAGNFWAGLVSPRSAPLDFMAPYPFLRRLTMRLPEALRPKPQRYGFAMQFSGGGGVLQTLQDPAGSYAMVTGVVDGGRVEDGGLGLIFTSLTEPRLGVMVPGP